MISHITADRTVDGKVALFIQNWGGDPNDFANWGEASLTRHPSDTVLGPEYGMSPWMGKGTSYWQTWTQLFVAKFESLRLDYNIKNPPIAPPARCFFDYEDGACTWSANTQPADAVGGVLFGQLELYKYSAMEWMTSRWSTEPVYGFGSGATMSSLYASDWPRFGDGTLAPEDIVTIGATDTHLSPANRQFSMWYSRLVYQSLEGALEIAAYTPIHNIWPNCLCSNYKTSADTDGEPAALDADWHAGTVVPSHTLKSHSRGMQEDSYDVAVSAGRFGNFPGGPGQNDLTWFFPFWHASSDLYSPNFYPMQAPGFLGNRWTSLHAYPGTSNVCTWEWPYSLAHQRFAIDSILHSWGEAPSERAARLCPWISPPYLTWGENDISDSGGYMLKQRDTRDQLALLRARAVPEMILWMPNYTPASPACFDTIPSGRQNTNGMMEGFTDAYLEVYRPTMIDIAGPYVNCARSIPTTETLPGRAEAIAGLDHGLGETDCVTLEWDAPNPDPDYAFYLQAGFNNLVPPGQESLACDERTFDGKINIEVINHNVHNRMIVQVFQGGTVSPWVTLPCWAPDGSCVSNGDNSVNLECGPHKQHWSFRVPNAHNYVRNNIIREEDPEPHTVYPCSLKVRVKFVPIPDVNGNVQYCSPGLQEVCWPESSRRMKLDLDLLQFVMCKPE
jgi:hypothetical protein